MHEHPKKIQAMQGSCKDYVPGLGPLPRRLLDQYGTLLFPVKTRQYSSHFRLTSEVDAFFLL